MSEDSFFQQLFKKLPVVENAILPIGPGDDCAAIAQNDGSLLLIAADQLIAGRHYTEETTPEDAGRKLLARNLSDIAAMGGSPTFCLVCLTFAKQNEEWLKRFYQGIINEAKLWNVAMIGGDIAKASCDCVASLTILGHVKKEQVVRRSGAKQGDLLCATGCFGNSFNTKHHLYFKPRLAEGKWLAEHYFVKSMMDVSDGLALDSFRLAQSSDCGLQLDLSQIPCRQQATISQALFDGEDYELLFTISPDSLEKLRQQWPFEELFTVLGKFITEPVLIDLYGNQIPLTAAWDHLTEKKED